MSQRECWWLRKKSTAYFLYRHDAELCSLRTQSSFYKSEHLGHFGTNFVSTSKMYARTTWGLTPGRSGSGAVTLLHPIICDGYELFVGYLDLRYRTSIPGNGTKKLWRKAVSRTSDSNSTQQRATYSTVQYLIACYFRRESVGEMGTMCKNTINAVRIQVVVGFAVKVLRTDVQ